MHVRPALESELEHLTTLWYEGWQDAHAAIVPAELKRRRTHDTFRERLRTGLRDVRVVGPEGAALGLCWVHEDELTQLYVAPAARGTGVAVTLMDDGEARLAAAGIETAWLSCAIGNRRAARFYEKRGWHLARNQTIDLDTPEGIFPLEIWRYEKRVG